MTYKYYKMSSAKINPSEILKAIALYKADESNRIIGPDGKPTEEYNYSKLVRVTSEINNGELALKYFIKLEPNKPFIPVKMMLTKAKTTSGFYVIDVEKAKTDKKPSKYPPPKYDRLAFGFKRKDLVYTKSNGEVEDFGAATIQLTQIFHSYVKANAEALKTDLDSYKLCFPYVAVAKDSITLDKIVLPEDDWYFTIKIIVNKTGNPRKIWTKFRDTTKTIQTNKKGEKSRITGFQELLYKGEPISVENIREAIPRGSIVSGEVSFSAPFYGLAKISLRPSLWIADIAVREFGIADDMGEDYYNQTVDEATTEEEKPNEPGTDPITGASGKVELTQKVRQLTIEDDLGEGNEVDYTGTE